MSQPDYLQNNMETVGLQNVEESVMPSMVSHGQTSQIHAAVDGLGSYDSVSAEKRLMDCFYEKLMKLHELSGLSFIFNFQDSKLNLYVLYKAVIERDGFLQVSQNGKWDEVASFLKLNNHLSLLPCQLKKVYENVLYRYEQMYCYRMPVKSSSKKEGHCLEHEDGLDCIAVQRKHYGNIPEDCREGQHIAPKSIPPRHVAPKLGSKLASIPPRHVATKSRSKLASKPPHHVAPKLGSKLASIPEECDEEQHVAPKLGSEPISGFDTPVQKSNVPISLVNEKMTETIDDPLPPQKSLTAYQIFLKGECIRLKNFHGEIPPGKLSFKEMAVEKWNNLSEIDRKPYFEKYLKYKEIHKREMGNVEQPRKNKRKKYQKKRSVTAPNDDHQVTMQVDDVNEEQLKPYKKGKRQNRSKQSISTPKDDDYHVTLEADVEKRQNRSKQSISTPKDDDYHVTLEANVENSFVPDKSLIESTIQELKHARPDDPIFQTDWNGFCET